MRCWTKARPPGGGMKYASDPAVREAILRWRGKVVAAADELGIQPKNLRKRLEHLGIDLAALRAGRFVGAIVSTPTGPHGSSGPSGGRVAPPASPSGTGRKNASGPYTSGSKAPMLSTVQAAMKDDVEEMAARAKRPLLRFHPEDQDRVHEARLDLIARHRVEFDGTAIVHDFFKAKFAEYMADRLKPNGKAEKAKR